jgi:TraT complement resistance protein
VGRIFLLLMAVTLATGCSNVIRSGLLSSNSIFLPPSSDRSVYVETHNISENQQVALADLGRRVAGKGYQITSSADRARYWLQANVVYCHTAGSGVTPEKVVQSGFATGIGSGGTALPGMNPFLGNAHDASDMTATTARMQAMMQQAMMQSGMGGAPPPQEKGVLYLCVADVRITERGKALSGAPTPPQHQMRMVASVRQKKLNLEEATPIIQEKLGTGIAGLF